MAVTLTPVPRFPMVRPGDDLAALLIAACEQGALAPADGDVVVVAQKIVSKAEGRYVDLAQVRPSARAESLAAQVDKDAAAGRSHLERVRSVWCATGRAC